MPDVPCAIPACSVIFVSSATDLHAKLRLDRGSVQFHLPLVDADCRSAEQARWAYCDLLGRFICAADA